MRVGVPKEIKDHEDRVGLVPSSVAELVHHGHEVLVERGAGVGAGLGDDQYVAAGARIVDKAEEIFAQSEMIVKVKEPLAAERKRLHRGQVLFTYLHLAPDREQTEDLLKSGVTAIAYETVTSPSGTLPLLTPMSEIAGRLAPQVGAHYLERTAGGRGVLLGGVPGVPPAEVVVLGGGVSGTHAATIALGMGATVFVVDRSAEVLRRLAAQFPGLRTIFSTRDALSAILRRADLLVGAVLVPGAAAPKLVTREMVASMKPNSVIVDIAIDQGGCVETIRETTHADPVYELHGVLHYGVGNVPAAVPNTSTYALTNATLPYVAALAQHGPLAAAGRDPALRAGVNTAGGHVTNPAVAEALGLPAVEPLTALAG
jgi:alanine dehydrogenase